jgi:hypothetical protein
MATDNILWVCSRPRQLRNDALLRPRVLDREGRRHWSTPVDLLHVGSLPLFLSFGENSRRVIARVRAAEACFPLSTLIFHFGLTGVCDFSGGQPGCFCTKALTQLMGKHEFCLVYDLSAKACLMYRSERAENKPDEQGWQDHWVKCSTTVRPEPPTRSPLGFQFSRVGKFSAMI